MPHFTFFLTSHFCRGSVSSYINNSGLSMRGEQLLSQELLKCLGHCESVIHFRLLPPSFWCVWRSSTIFCPSSYADLERVFLHPRILILPLVLRPRRPAVQPVAHSARLAFSSKGKPVQSKQSCY